MYPNLSTVFLAAFVRRPDLRQGIDHVTGQGVLRGETEADGCPGSECLASVPTIPAIGEFGDKIFEAAIYSLVMQLGSPGMFQCKNSLQAVRSNQKTSIFRPDGGHAGLRILLMSRYEGWMDQSILMFWPD